MIGSYVDGDQKAQHQPSLANAQKLWNEKGLQCMVLVSFALQLIILFNGGLRRRRFHFSVLLWLSYQMADFVAVFVLAHLSLQTNDPHHQLVLLWAPVLLLHLGGQDNATAFSMEDNELWKRHFLGLITQVVLAVYVVAKSWRDKQLVAPVVLLFLSGTVKYVERTWALKTATPQAIKDKHMGDVYEALKKFQDPKGNLVPSEIGKYSQEIVGRNKWWLQEDYADLVQAAFDSLPGCMGVLCDVPVAPWMLPSILKMTREISQRDRGGLGQVGRKKDWSFSSRAYKMVEIQLMLMSDRLYTKVGIRYNQPMILRIGLRLLTFGTTWTTLLLVVTARKDNVYSRVDILVTYILLAGAVTLEAWSMLTVTLSSYCFLREKFGVNMFTRAIFCPLRIGQSFPYWSSWVYIYNLIGGCIMEKQASSLTRVVCPPHYYSIWICISEETKGLICNELDDEVRCQQFSHVRGQGILSLRGHREGSELYDSIDKVDFPRSVLTWHLVTDICFFLTGGVTSQHDQPRMRVSREVSNYLMDLLMQQCVMNSSEGYVAHLRAREEVKLMLAHHGDKVRRKDDIEAIKKMLEAGLSRRVVDTMPSHSDEVEGHVVDIAPEITDAMRPVLPQAWSLAQILLRDDDPADGGSEQGGGAPWELIASVWMEMLFYLAPRCQPKFHAEKLSNGGEFITYVRFLLHNRGLGWNRAPTRT